MKKFIFLMTMFITSILNCSAQKNYLSIESGRSATGIGNRLSDNMKANSFAAKVAWDLYFIFLPVSGTSSYPKQETSNGTIRIRYGYNIKERASVEAGFGSTYNTRVSGANASGNNVNYLSIYGNLSTAYMAYIWINKKGNAGIGAGPAVSILNIKQEDGNTAAILSNRNYILPGGIVTAYLNYVDKKNWFMGFRTEMTVNAAVQTEEVKVINQQDKNFISVSKGTSVGAVMNSFTLTAGVKF